MTFPGNMNNFFYDAKVNRSDRLISLLFFQSDNLLNDFSFYFLFKFLESTQSRPFLMDPVLRGTPADAGQRRRGRPAAKKRAQGSRKPKGVASRKKKARSAARKTKGPSRKRPSKVPSKHEPSPSPVPSVS